MSTLNKKKLIAASIGSIATAIWYIYWRETRSVSSNCLIPDENRTEMIPKQELGWWMNGSNEEKFSISQMSDLHQYLSKKPLKIIQFKTEGTLNLRVLDAGCGTAGILFRLASNKNITKGIGIDLSSTNINICNEKLNGNRPLIGLKSDCIPSVEQMQDKLSFVNKDCCHLKEFAENYFDIGYSVLVMHDMPDRVPITMLCEMSRVCKYLVIVDWSKNLRKWSKSGMKVTRIEFAVGPKHFAGFRHFLQLGGIEAHIQSLMKYRENVKILLYKTLDSGTFGLYILDTSHAQKVSKL